MQQNIVLSSSSSSAVRRKRRATQCTVTRARRQASKTPVVVDGDNVKELVDVLEPSVDRLDTGSRKRFAWNSTRSNDDDAWC